MTLKECYAALGGDYDAVLGRLPGEKFVQKFVLKFLNDGSYQLLLDSLAAGDRVQLVRQYPEWDFQVRFPARGHGRLLWYCTRHGLFYQNI